MDIDKCKENIQPLRGGRNISQLGTALQAQSNVDAQRLLLLQKEEHELMITNYDGPDPLDPWFNYIQWLEQCFPKHGHEGHIDKVIKDCLTRFDKVEQYHQDRRLVKLWIKYIDCLANPLEIYQMLHTKGIGTECAEFYRAWACYHEEAGDFKKANQVFLLGLQANAQPMDELSQAHMNFQLFFAQQMLHDDSPTKRKAASALAETRMALTSLRTFKRRNVAAVPVVRVGDNIKDATAGVVRQQTTEKQPGGSNIMVNIYQDQASTSSAGAETGVVPGSVLEACNDMENQKEVGIWTNAKTKMAVARVVPTQQLPFAPFEDDELILSPNHVSYCLDDLSTFCVPLCVPDPPNSGNIPCYNKAAVYADNTEYSLEEIKAREYLSKWKAKVNQLRLQEEAVATSSTASYREPAASSSNYGGQRESQFNALQTLASCALDGEAEHMENLMPASVPALQNVKLQNADSPGEPRVIVNLDSNEMSEMTKAPKPIAAESRQGSSYHQQAHVGQFGSNKPAGSGGLRMEYNDENAVPPNVGLGKRNIEDFNKSLMGSLQNDSVTVNTREARWELRNLFNDTEPSIVQPPVVQPMQQFDIREDESMTMAIKFKSQTGAPRQDEPHPQPNDKENGIPTAQRMYSQNNQPVFNVNDRTMFDEPSCTQVFNFNVVEASTPNPTHFKKPGLSLDAKSAPPVRKFSIEDQIMGNEERRETSKGGQEHQRAESFDRTVNNIGHHHNELSVIMESTRENGSKTTSSGSSGASRNTISGFAISQQLHEKTHHASTANYEFGYNQQNDPSMLQKKNSATTQPRLSNGQFARSYSMQSTPKTPQVPPDRLSNSNRGYNPIDHQYQKPTSSVNYNGYSGHRTAQAQGYQHGFGTPASNYQQSPAYAGHPQNAQQNYTAPQPYPSPNANNYHSPQHPGVQSPHHPGIQSPHHPGIQSPHHPGVSGLQSPNHISPGFQSPHAYQNSQMGYQSPIHSVPSSPQPVFSNQTRSDYQTTHQGYPASANAVPVPQAYASPQPAANPYQNNVHRTPGYQNNVQNVPQYQRNNYASPQMQQNQHYYQQQTQQQQAQHQQQQMQQQQHLYNNQYQTNQHHNSYTSNSQQNYQNPNYQQAVSQQSPYAMQQKPAPENQSYSNHNANPSNAPFHIYQSPSQNQHQNSHGTSQNQIQSNAMNRPQPMQTSPSESYTKQNSNKRTTPNNIAPSHSAMQQQNVVNQNENSVDMEMQDKSKAGANQSTQPNTQPAPYKSPTSILRSVRHEQQHGKPQTPEGGFSNQFLNFISSRNEPKDNANTPKFTSSPGISQKMHKNLYVSSPEQAQIPPASTATVPEAKETAMIESPIRTQTSKSNISNNDKQKDLSKRQLDFEMKSEMQSEDSRDSVSKESSSRVSSMHSRQSVRSGNTDGMMDVDSESSMECSTFKSMFSNSAVETCDIPRPANIKLPKVIDPFSNDLCNSLLQYVKFPNKTHIDGYIEMRSVPKLQQSTLIVCGNYRFSVERQLGKGTYGSVFCSVDLNSNRSIALKYQKPGHPWEFYICKEIKARVKDPFMLLGYMDICLAFLGDNASIFVSELSSFGSLLDVANKVKVATSKCITEVIVMLLTSEMLSIIHYLHKAQIIHGDIKPDNFLLMKIPTSEWRTPSLQLIDMGCAIDMSLFPEGTTFRKVISTEGFTCNEMREGKPWTFQTDLFCLAGTVHVILFGHYMKTVNKLGHWNIEKKFARYMKAKLWDKLFTTLLNVESCQNLPDLMDLKDDIDQMLRNNSDDLTSQLRTFANVLKSK